MPLSRSARCLDRLAELVERGARVWSHSREVVVHGLASLPQFQRAGLFCRRHRPKTRLGRMGLLEEHVRRFNEGVRTSDFAPMAAAFAEDAEMHFEGVPVGPFVGRDAIAAAYRDQPPDDEVEIFDTEERDGMIVARYAWLRDEGKQSGEMRLTPRNGRIQKLVVTFG
jgi:steroid Delta-isomerase